MPLAEEAWANQSKRALLVTFPAWKKVPTSSPDSAADKFCAEVKSMAVPLLAAIRAASILVTIPPLPTPAEPAPPISIPSNFEKSVTSLMRFAPFWLGGAS